MQIQSTHLQMLDAKIPLAFTAETIFWILFLLKRLLYF